MNEEFVTKLNHKDVTVHGLLHGLVPDNLLKDLIIDANTTAFVEWSIEMEARNYGIKSMLLSVTKVSFDVEWSVSDDELSSSDIELLTIPSVGGSHSNFGFIEGKVSMSVTPSDEHWKIVSNDFTVKSDSVQPDDVCIDFEKKIINISN